MKVFLGPNNLTNADTALIDSSVITCYLIFSDKFLLLLFESHLVITLPTSIPKRDYPYSIGAKCFI